MSDISASIFRVSMNILAFAVKGNQNGIVQQQIETMGPAPMALVGRRLDYRFDPRRYR